MSADRDGVKHADAVACEGREDARHTDGMNVMTNVSLYKQNYSYRNILIKNDRTCSVMWQLKARLGRHPTRSVPVNASDMCYADR